MALKLFNTLSRSVQEFTPLDPAGRQVGLYCCGPTVYDFAHIGNWRTFLFIIIVDCRRFIILRIILRWYCLSGIWWLFGSRILTSAFRFDG